MLSYSEIKKNYPTSLHQFPRFILREYLQYRLLRSIFESRFASQYAFLGGTCLRIVHGNQRFSEDLDFDNFQLSEAEFESLSIVIQKDMAAEGYEVEMQTVHKGAYHCYIRFPELLFKEGLSGHRSEKILIQLDTEPQNFDFQPTAFLLNQFDVFTQIFVTPPDLLLSQKFYAICNRPRNKGRDFFDANFLLSFTRPNYDYLHQKLGVKDEKSLKDRLLARCSELDMAEMAADVQPFLFNPSDTKRVTLFPDLIRQAKL